MNVNENILVGLLTMRACAVGVAGLTNIFSTLEFNTIRKPYSLFTISPASLYLVTTKSSEMVFSTTSLSSAMANKIRVRKGTERNVFNVKYMVVLRRGTATIVRMGK